MAGKGNLATLKPFKPGQSGNGAGRAGVLPPEIRRLRKENQAGLIRMIHEMFTLNDEDMEKKVMAAATTQLEKATLAIIGKAKQGDVTAFKYLMDVMVGRIPEHDYDGFTEEDLVILNRVKEVFAERQRAIDSVTDVEAGH